MPLSAEHAAFAERVLLQLRSRYHDVGLAVDLQRFGISISGPGIDTTLPLSPLYHTVQRDPGQTAAHISRYVASVEQQLQPHVATTFAMARALWCVRGERYLRGLSRADELPTRMLPGRLVAFVAEELPGSIMRGVAREDFERSGLTESEVRTSAQENVERRFQRLADRVRTSDRVPADGWRMSSDTLFQGSALLSQSVLAALHERCGGEVMLGNPDRGVVLAIAAASAAASRFSRRVTKEYREALNPVSPVVLRYDGTALLAAERGRRVSGPVMPWLEE